MKMISMFNINTIQRGNGSDAKFLSSEAFAPLFLNQTKTE